MQTALIIVIFIALLGLAYYIKMRRLRRATLNIIEQFQQQSAVREKRARTLEQLGLQTKSKVSSFVRDPQVEALSQLMQRGIIIPVQDQQENAEVRYYLNEESIRQDLR